MDYYLNYLEDINYSDNLGNNVLFYAIQSNNLDSVKKILEKGIDINHLNFDYSSALHEACKSSNYHIVKELLDRNITIEQKDINGNKALFYAENNNNGDIINLISLYSKIERQKKKARKKSTLDSFIKDFNKDPIDEI